MHHGLDQRHVEEADIITMRVLGAGSQPGLHWVTPENDSTIAQEVGGPERTFAPGSIVMVGAVKGSDRRRILQEAPPGRAGGSVWAPESLPQGEIDAVGVTFADPDVWVPGVQAVTLQGYGFREEPVDDIRLMVWDATTRAYAADPYAIFDSLTYVSSTELSAVVNVFATPPENWQWGALAQRSY